MKKLSLATLVFLLFFGTNSFTQETEKIELIEIDASYFGEVDYTTNFQEKIDINSFKGEPAFKINSSTTSNKAEGWIGATPEAIYFLVKVYDNEHFNEFKDYNLWQGDAVQIGIDAKGDGTQGNDKSLGGAFGDDDVAFTFGIGAAGQQGWIHFRGKHKSGELVNEKDLTISRKKNITSYFIRLSWELLSTQPALYPNFGVAIQINDVVKGSKEQDRYSWGEGAGGRMNPGLFKKVRLEGFTQEFADLDIQNSTLWENSKADFLLSYKSDKDIDLKAEYGTGSLTKVLEKSSEVKRYRVLATPVRKTRNDTPFKINLTDTKKETLAEIEANIVIPIKVLHAFIKKVDKLIETSPHELFTRHLKSIKAIATVEWSRSELVVDVNKRHADETLGFVTSMLEGLNGPAGNWENYKAGKLSLIMSFISARDRTQQFYVLDLPKNWNPEKEYPLFVELHGAGNQNPLSGPATYLSGKGSLDLKGYESIRGFVAQQGAGYHIQPFARGNTRYHDIGEIDVWESFHDVHQMFKIDENRRYLFGFSMGGGGTAYIGLHTPHLWAAIAIYSGAYRGNPATGLGRNVSYLPVWMWCGQIDNLHKNMKQLESEIVKYGPQPDTTWVPNLGHNYRSDGQEAGINWLQQYTRKRPDKFSFVSDDDNHTNTWGINMKRDLSVSGMPFFDCEIDGNKVKINSEGTEELTVQFGKNGLQLEGEVTVVWNGKEVYKGIAKPIRMNSSGISDFDPNKRDRWSSTVVQDILKQY